MPTKFRLTRADFKLFSSQKMRRVRSLFFMVVIAPLPIESVPKVACVVSKKVSRKATDRNRVKRQCRATLVPLISQVNQSVALAFYANPASNKATFEQLSKDINSFLHSNKFLE